MYAVLVTFTLGAILVTFGGHQLRVVVEEIEHRERTNGQRRRRRRRNVSLPGLSYVVEHIEHWKLTNGQRRSMSSRSSLVALRVVLVTFGDAIIHRLRVVEEIERRK